MRGAAQASCIVGISYEWLFSIDRLNCRHKCRHFVGRVSILLENLLRPQGAGYHPRLHPFDCRLPPP